ncbi:MAG: AMP-binding protein, partial [Endomicrobium sp.]|nr:AMP-binding protein [Endomicrobium sp.]
MQGNSVIEQVILSIKKFPDRNAFFICGKFYTYNEFAKNISKIRKSLLEKNIINQNVGIVANDDIETYASIFALWLEGLAYVPLHPLQPIDRNQEIISQAGIKIVLSSGACLFSGVDIIKTAQLVFDEF